MSETILRTLWGSEKRLYEKKRREERLKKQNDGGGRGIVSLERSPEKEDKTGKTG